MVPVLAVLIVFWVAYVASSATKWTDFPWTRRRSHFARRVVFACLAGPLLLLVLATPVLLGAISPDSSGTWTALIASTLLWLVTAAFAPALYFARAPSTDGPPDGDDDGGSPPEGPPSPVRPPGGGMPRPDAEQSRTRMRDHCPRLHTPPARRAPERPGRVPGRPRPARRAS